MTKDRRFEMKVSDDFMFRVDAWRLHHRDENQKMPTIASAITALAEAELDRWESSGGGKSAKESNSQERRK